MNSLMPAEARFLVLGSKAVGKSGRIIVILSNLLQSEEYSLETEIT